MKLKKEEFVGIGRCPECNRPVYMNEVNHKMIFSCKVHPCLSKKEYYRYMEDKDTDYWRNYND